MFHALTSYLLPQFMQAFIQLKNLFYHKFVYHVHSVPLELNAKIQIFKNSLYPDSLLDHAENLTGPSGD